MYANAIPMRLHLTFGQLPMHEYHSEIARLELVNLGAADYLKSVDPTLWVTAFYAGPYYGHKTSNVVESTNKVFKDQRELPIPDLLDAIWHYTMNCRFKRYIKVTQLGTGSQIHTEFGFQQLPNNQRWAMANSVVLSSLTSGLVTQSNHKTYVTNLHLRTCTCGHFQENGIPCGHAFTLIRSLQSHIPVHPNPRDYVPYYFTIVA